MNFSFCFYLIARSNIKKQNKNSIEIISGSEGFRTELGPNQFVGAASIRQLSPVKADFDCRISTSPVRVLQMTYADLEAAKQHGESDSEPAMGNSNGSISDCDTPILERKYSNPIAPSDVTFQ